MGSGQGWRRGTMLEIGERKEEMEKGGEQDGLEAGVYAWYVCVCVCMLVCRMCVAWLRGSIDRWASPNCLPFVSPTPSIPTFITPTCFVSPLIEG